MTVEQETIRIITVTLMMILTLY